MHTDFTTNLASPLLTAIKIGLVILGGEFLIMVAIEGVFTPLFGSEVSPIFWEFLDPVLLAAIVAPALYILVLRPMKKQQLILEKQRDELGIAAVTFNVQDGVVVTDVHHNILKVNQSFTTITGYSSEEMIGKTPALLQSGRQDGDFYRRMHESLQVDKFWQGEIWNRRKNGEIYPEWLTITLVTGKSGNMHYVGIFSDITKRKAYEEKINFMAYHDQLTELPSRELFYDSLSSAMSLVRRRQDNLALFYLDLDGFKAVNDNYGHEAGDTILKATSKRLLTSVREGDTVARLGGDEFAIILSGIQSKTDATIVAEKIIRNLSEPISINNGCAIVIGVSIGIAIYPENGTEIDKLMSAADGAMYKSKENGPNIFTFSEIQANCDSDIRNWIILDKTHLHGITELDQSHLSLANTLNQLNDAVRSNESDEAMTGLINALAAEIRVHFNFEDSLMEKYGYFDNDAHKIEHQRLLEELDYLKEKFNHGGEMVVLHTLKEWLLNHIATSDKVLCEHILSKHKTKRTGIPV